MTTDTETPDIAAFKPSTLQDINRLLSDSGYNRIDEDDPLAVQVVIAQSMVSDVARLLDLHHRATSQTLNEILSDFEARQTPVTPVFKPDSSSLNSPGRAVFFLIRVFVFGGIVLSGGFLIHHVKDFL